MINLSESLTVTLPISSQAYQLAEQFSLHYRNPDKAQQVYRNTLAVWTVRFYLQCMAIETNWEASLSMNPATQTLMSVADLEVQGLGKIECCPVLPIDNFVRIPLEDCVDRIGYVVVKLNESQKQATLLGFIKTVPENGELAISQLQSIDVMLLQLSRPTQVKQPIHLQQWLNNIFDIGWESIESFFGMVQKTSFAYRYRTTQQNTRIQKNQNLKVERGKLLNLGQHTQAETIILFVELNPTANEEIDIWVKVYPGDSQKYLPEDLQLLILDENGIAVMQAIARNAENIQVNFQGKVEEEFSIELILNGETWIEKFVV
ncbi:MAG: DUF1822 family protein [Nostoc desertorum CM1-VF14]|jgi:hypothetical protein|nr:DUF1822 family protein [Nostoc desertorum CM1-VF14]